MLKIAILILACLLGSLAFAVVIAGLHYRKMEPQRRSAIFEVLSQAPGEWFTTLAIRRGHPLLKSYSTYGTLHEMAEEGVLEVGIHPDDVDKARQRVVYRIPRGTQKPPRRPQ